MSPDEHAGGGRPGNECALHGERQTVSLEDVDDKEKGIFEISWSSRRSLVGCAAGEEGLGGDGTGEDGAEPIICVCMLFLLSVVLSVETGTQISKMNKGHFSVFLFLERSPLRRPTRFLKLAQKGEEPLVLPQPKHALSYF
jgi:hypothetical protein